MIPDFINSIQASLNWLVDMWVLLASSISWPIAVIIAIMLLRKDFTKFVSNFVGKIEEAQYGSNGVRLRFSHRQEKPEENFTSSVQRTLDEIFATTDESLQKNTALQLIVEWTTKLRPTLEKGFQENDKEQWEGLDYKGWLELRCIEFMLIISFEQTYRSIYGSQIQALEELILSGGRLDKSALKKFYEIGKSSFPRMYENYSYDEWLAYLEGSNLITIDGEFVVAKKESNVFIQYIIAKELTKNRLG